MPYFENPRPEDHVNTFLSTIGGVTDATGNYILPTEFAYTAEAGYETLIRSLAITIAGKDQPERKRYGGLKNALDNGYAVEIIRPDGVLALALTAGRRIRQNGDFATQSFLVNSGIWEGKEKTTTALFRFKPAVLLLAGYKLRVTLNDDFSKLFDHTFHILGRRLNI